MKSPRSALVSGIRTCSTCSMGRSCAREPRSWRPGSTIAASRAPGVAALTGRGVFYGAAMTDAHLYRGAEVFVVGGANSAGQAALHLAQQARRATLVVRGDSPASAISPYLTEQIDAASTVNVMLQTRIVRAAGVDRLQEVVLVDSTGNERTVPADALFVMIGQRPASEWAVGGLARDAEGFFL